jgi:carbonic anhydrase/acetyltransferase-like protein (isoleucine patch superfamily)
LEKDLLLRHIVAFSGEFPDYSIIAGNPAQVVGTTKKKDQEFLDKNPDLKKSYYDSEFV